MRKSLYLGILLLLSILVLSGCGNTIKARITASNVSKITLNDMVIDETEYDLFINELNGITFSKDEISVGNEYTGIYIEQGDKIHSFYLYDNSVIEYITNQDKVRYYYKDAALVQKLTEKINELNINR